MTCIIIPTIQFCNSHKVMQIINQISFSIKSMGFFNSFLPFGTRLNLNIIVSCIIQRSTNTRIKVSRVYKCSNTRITWHTRRGHIAGFVLNITSRVLIIQRCITIVTGHGWWGYMNLIIQRRCITIVTGRGWWGYMNLIIQRGCIAIVTGHGWWGYMNLACEEIMVWQRVLVCQSQFKSHCIIHRSLRHSGSGGCKVWTACFLTRSSRVLLA